MKTIRASSASFRCALTPLAVGLLSLAPTAFTHPLENWHLRYSAPTGNGLRTVTCSQDLFVAAGDQGFIVTSADGTNWAPQASGTTTRLFGVANGNHTLIAVGEGGAILSSPDGTNWAQRMSGVTARLHSVQFGNGLFLVAGEFTNVLTSPDGTNWSAQTPGLPFQPYFIAYGNGLFLLEGTGSASILSRDGTNWFSRPSGTTAGLYTAGFGRDRFLSIDILSQVWTSLDASNWTQRGSVQVVRPPQVGYGNGCFLVVGNGGTEYSETGDHWSQALTNLFVSSVTFGQGTFIITAGLAIWQSDPVVRLEMPSPGTLLLAGPPGRVYHLESSSALDPASQWLLLTNLTLATSPQTWTDPAPSPSGQRFYRAVLLP